MKLLAISGSLRAVSTNTALLQAAQLLAPDGVEIELYDGLVRLPHFNPDLDIEPAPAEVRAWREKVRAADGLLISSPEYARGIPGSFKNAFDWLVSHDGFPDKPVAFFHASERAIASQAAMRLVFETMSARIVDAATITVPLLGKQADARAIAADAEISAKIRAALEAFVKAIKPSLKGEGEVVI
jgi:NAD(P)H-dependent FMN reductase